MISLYMYPIDRKPKSVNFFPAKKKAGYMIVDDDDVNTRRDTNLLACQENLNKLTSAHPPTHLPPQHTHFEKRCYAPAT